MPLPEASRIRIVAFLVSCAVAAGLAACGDDGPRYRSPTAPDFPTQPTQPAPPPPPPSADVTGTWEGIFEGNQEGCDINGEDCADRSGAAGATFQQVGASVSGVLTNEAEVGGFRDAHFEGRMEGSVILGPIVDFFPGANADGVVYEAELELTVRNSYGYSQGVMRLRRRP